MVYPGCPKQLLSLAPNQLLSLTHESSSPIYNTITFVLELFLYECILVYVVVTEIWLSCSLESPYVHV